MMKTRRVRYLLFFCFATFALLMMMAAAVASGSVHLSFSQIIHAILGTETDAMTAGIVLKIRLPRVLLSALLGGALALSGFLLQTFFGNPIAGPFVLGISSGAKLAVALVMIILLEQYSYASSLLLVLAAFAGALMATGIILLLSKRVRRMSVLLIAGIMIGYICSALTNLIVAFAEDANIINLHYWSLGSFSGANDTSVLSSAVIVLTTLLIVFLLSKPMGAFQMGESYAKSMGVPVRKMQITMIVLSSILSACVAAFAGPISFVGIAVPFLAKKWLGTAQPLIVTPAIFILGAFFCVLADLVARTVFSPVELNVSTVTSIFFAPVALFMMLKRSERL